MFATPRSTAVFMLGAALSVCPLAADARAQQPMRATQTGALKNSFAPTRPNVSSLRTAPTGRRSGVLMAVTPLASGAGESSSGDGGSGSGGGGSQGSSDQSQPAQREAAPDVRYVSPYDLPEGSKRDTGLAALRAHGGGLNWPIGLRSMGPAEKMDKLREQIDDVVEAVLRQSASEPAPAELVQAAAERIKFLSERFERIVVDMPLSRAQEKDARQFLRKAYIALKTLEPGTAQAALETKK